MKRFALAVLPALLSGPAAACSVCFGGKSNQGLANGLWWGILLLLTATMSMLGGIGWLLWKVESSRQADEARG